MLYGLAWRDMTSEVPVVTEIWASPRWQKWRLGPAYRSFQCRVFPPVAYCVRVPG
jgi:hypothetical protein